MGLSASCTDGWRSADENQFRDITTNIPIFASRRRLKGLKLVVIIVTDDAAKAPLQLSQRPQNLLILVEVTAA